MKQTKKLLSIILSICMLLSITAGIDFSAYALSSSGSCGANVKYTFNKSTGKIVISGKGAMYNYYGDSPFDRRSSIKAVVINSGVTSIGDDAFDGCTGLTSVTIPNSVTSIGDWAFYECTGLTSVTIPNSVTSIGRSVFYECTGLKSITIPNSVTSIGDYAFSGCRGITSLTIPNSVTSIGKEAFSGCTGLKELTMPASAKIYNSEYTFYNSFYNCSNIEKVTLTKGTGTMQNYTEDSSSYYDTNYQYTPWYISRNKIKKIVIEDGITSIGNYAFCGCTGLTSLTIPDSVTRIGDHAFSGCAGLTSVTIPDSVTSIGNWAFSGVTNIKYYGIASYSPWGAKSVNGYVDGYLVYSASSKTELLGCSSRATQVTIPNSVTWIGEDAFAYCTSLISVAIPNSVDCIGANAFYQCKNLKNVYYCGTRSELENVIQYSRLDGSLYTNHKYIKTVTTHATFNRTGINNYTCAMCGDSYKKTISAIYSVKLSATKYTYDGKVKSPTLTVKDSSGKTLVKGTDYTVTVPTGRKNVGKYTYKITFKGNYSGTKSLSFVINPKNTSISKLTATKGGFKATIKKYTTQTTGYQIRYSTSAKMAKAKTVTVAKNTTTSKSVSKLSKGKKYYVQIRTFKTVNGTKYYSAWSGNKTVTTKK